MRGLSLSRRMRFPTAAVAFYRSSRLLPRGLFGWPPSPHSGGGSRHQPSGPWRVTAPHSWSSQGLHGSLLLALNYTSASVVLLLTPFPQTTQLECAVSSHTLTDPGRHTVQVTPFIDDRNSGRTNLSNVRRPLSDTGIRIHLFLAAEPGLTLCRAPEPRAPFSRKQTLDMLGRWGERGTRRKVGASVLCRAFV